MSSGGSFLNARVMAGLITIPSSTYISVFLSAVWVVAMIVKKPMLQMSLGM
jgi:hypothetical protein